MKREEAKIVAKEWSRYLIEFVQQILAEENAVTAKLVLSTAKTSKPGKWCVFDLSVSNDFYKSGATKVPQDHSVVLANQILEDLEKLMEEPSFDFSYYDLSKVRSMLGGISNYDSIYLVGPMAKMQIVFARVIPDKEHVVMYNNALTLREEQKNVLEGNGPKL